MDAILQAPSLRFESSEGLLKLQPTLDENLMTMEAMGINIEQSQFFLGSYRIPLSHLLRTTQSFSAIDSRICH